MDAASKELEKFARQEKSKFVADIEGQRFRSFIEKPLSFPWLQRKKNKKADTRVMIATHTYVSKIKIFRTKTPSLRRWNITLAKSAMALDLDRKKTNMPLRLVARIQELGSIDGRIPARPHWKPHRIRMAGRARILLPFVRQRARRAVYNRLRKTK